MSFQLLRALKAGVWLIHPEEAQGYLPVVTAFMEGKPVAGLLGAEEEGEKSKGVETAVFAAGKVVRSSYYSDFSDPEIPEGSTALIPVAGPIMKYGGYCGGASSERITQYVKQANANPNISNLLFKIDSPGGQVDGTQTAAQAIAASVKPTLAYVDDGMAASAAYWFASAADEVWVSQKTDRVGSIGAYRPFQDASKYYEKMGVVVEDVYADQSTEKNQDYREAMKGNFKPMKEQGLNPMVEAFISAVKENRGNRLNTKAGDPFKGALYMADEALAIGLIDKVGTFDEALSHLQSLSNQSNNSKTETSMSLKDWFAKAGDEKTVSVEASELATLKADMETAQSNLDAAEKANGLLQATNEQLSADLTAAQAALAAAETARTEAQAKADKFGKQAGAAHTAPVKEKTEGGNAEAAKTEEEIFAGYAHNQEAIEKIKNL